VHTLLELEVSFKTPLVSKHIHLMREYRNGGLSGLITIE